MTDAIEAAPAVTRRTDVIRERGTGALRLLRSVARNRRLVLELARREMIDAHAGQMAGVVWLALHPIVMFVVYATLFTIVFKVRIGDRGPSDYLVYLFSGLAPWLMTQDAVLRSANAMIANANIVKKVMLPLETLVAKSLVASTAVQGIILGLTLIYTIVQRGGPPPIFPMLVPLLILHGALIWGLALLLSSLMPYFRDIGELLRVFMTINIYLMPVMYSPDMVPGQLRILLPLNPFSHLIWCYQDVIYHNAFIHPWSWLATGLFAAIAVLAGSHVFLRLRHHLSSVL